MAVAKPIVSVPVAARLTLLFPSLTSVPILNTPERATLTLMACIVLYLVTFDFVVEAFNISRHSTTFSIKFVFVQYQPKRTIR